MCAFRFRCDKYLHFKMIFSYFADISVAIDIFLSSLLSSVRFVIQKVRAPRYNRTTIGIHSNFEESPVFLFLFRF